jgi:cbb3-type cytochrome oxidase subunit 3
MNIIKEFIANTGKDIALGFIDSSYWICLFVCMLAIIFYMVGSKKSGRVASISFVIYVLSQACKLGLK